MKQQPIFIQLPSAPMHAIYNTIRQIGKPNIPFFITGETGVGKESLARYIHENGPRRDRPFIPINCSRFYTELLQSELFGHEAGAFTSAIHQRRGAFEIADGGILFFDEIPDMSLTAQKMLLRVLDTASFTRLGGNEVLTVDVHIVAATNKDIMKTVARKALREDLYHRLKGMVFHLPPLRERPEDIPPLVEAFISEFSGAYEKNVTGIIPEVLMRLAQEAWPGNIRELRSRVQIAVALATAERLEPKDFPDLYPELAPTLNIENMSQNQILRAVAQKRIQQYPSLRDAAESLDIDIRTLQRYAQWKESDE